MRATDRPLTAEVRDRLAKLCGMTDSDRDGEALNAIWLANKLLRQHH